MALPTVLVFQEFATITAVPTTPDLNCLVVGPAYQIQDYPDDKTSIEVSAYGTLQADNPYTPPVASTAAITLAAAPNLTAGAWVDPTSVKVYFDEARAILQSGTDGASAANDNTLTAATATFVTNGVAAGDTLIVDNPAGPATPNLILTVLSVDSETVLRVATNFTATVAGTLKYRVETTLSDQLVDSAFVTVPTFRQSNQIVILGGVTVTIGVLTFPVAYARVYVEYRAFRTDLQNLDTVADTTEILTKIGRNDSRNPLAAAVSTAKQNSGQSPVQFYGVETDDLTGYTKAKDAISSDDSVYAIVPTTTDINVISMFKADNVSLADPTVSLASSIQQKFRVVIGAGNITATSAISTEVVTGTDEVLAPAVPPGIKTITLVGLTALTTNLRPGDQLILSASENAAPLDGTYTIAHINSQTQLELDEALPVTVGALEGLNYQVDRPSTGATVVALVDGRAALTSTNTVYTSRIAGVGPGVRTIALVEDATTPGAIQSIVEAAGVSTVINGNWAAASITSQNVVDALNTGSGVVVPFSGSVNIVASTTNAAAKPIALLGVALSTGTPGTDKLTSATALDDVYIRLFDSNAMFITDGVTAGDIIEIPTDPTGVFTTGDKQFTVNTVLSEQRLEIVNVVSGAYVNNTSTVENELPHADNRLGTGTTVSMGSIRYRVTRELTKDQQVTDLVARAQSLKSRRAIMVWPDLVTVAGLVDGSLTANADGSAAAAGPQPGWYLAAVVGGMTAGLPSQQGFSRLGTAGVSGISNSSDYFTETQLATLSDGGWYVFAQKTPSSIPFSIHQLTTDPSTLESGEYSIVKNFDFVSVFYLDLLIGYLGIWNVNADTLGFMRQSLNTGTDNLKLRRVAKIGAPIIDATITSLAESTASADRVEAYMELTLPKPLNTIGLHLVA